MRTSKRLGTTRVDMIRTARRLGFMTRTKNNSTLRDIRWYLTRKIPVIVLYIEPGGDEHYSLVVALGKDSITLSDPYHGRRVRYSRRAFKEIWRGQGHNAWTMAVYPREVW